MTYSRKSECVQKSIISVFWIYIVFTQLFILSFLSFLLSPCFDYSSRGLKKSRVCLFYFCQWVCLHGISESEGVIHEKLKCYFGNLLVFALGLVIHWYFLYFKEITLIIILFWKSNLLERLPLNNICFLSKNNQSKASLCKDFNCDIWTVIIISPYKLYCDECLVLESLVVVVEPFGSKLQMSWYFILKYLSMCLPNARTLSYKISTLLFPKNLKWI